MASEDHPRLLTSATIELCNVAENLKLDCVQQAQNKSAKSFEEIIQLLQYKRLQTEEVGVYWLSQAPRRLYLLCFIPYYHLLKLLKVLRGVCFVSHTEQEM